MTQVTSTKRAVLLVCLAYCWWGMSALFWREFASLAPVDQLSFRVSGGFAYLSLVWMFRKRNPFRSLTAAHWRFGLFAAANIGINWVVFLWAISNERAVEASLGYFLMPLFAVGLGVVLLGERPRQLQKIALGFAVVGIIWTFAALGSVPWVSLSLGSSFALYGWARKKGPWQAVDGLTFETMLLAPFLLVVLGWRGFSGINIIGDAADGSLWVMALIPLSGLVTIVPLLLFAYSAKHVSLTVIGLLQYINPTLQFLVGWRIFGEEVSRGRFIAFAWIWLALVLVVVDELRSQSPVDGGEAGGGKGGVGGRKRLASEEPAVR